MPDTNISANIIGKCIPAASVDTSRIDGLTMVSIEPTKPSQLDDIYRDKDNALWRVIGNLLEADFRGKACQAKVNGFADWLKGTARVTDPEKMTISNLKTGLYDVRPFIEMEVENPINNLYWSFTSGTAAAGGEVSPNLGLPFEFKGIVASQKGIPVDVRWFGTRTVVTISGVGTGSSHVVASYQVVDASLVGSDLYIYMNNIGNNTDDPIYAYDDNHYKRANVARGVLTRGLPNVSTGEAYCDNIPGLNMTQMKPFWIQNTRFSIREDDQYKQFAKLISENNPLFKKFGDVDSVRYNRQVMEDRDNRMVHTFLTNPALVNQTVEKYPALEKAQFYVGDTNSPTYTWQGRYQLRKASAIGYFEQMAECSGEDGAPQLVDMLGAALDLVTLRNKFYNILKVRKARGLDGKMLELWVTSDFREKLVDAYTTYFKAKSQDTLRLNMTTKENTIGFSWVSIQLDYPNVELRLVSHQALDDYVAAHKAAALAAGDNEATAEAYKKVGNLAFCPDWSATYRAILDSGTVTMETGTPQEIARVDSSLLCGPLVAPQQRVKHYWETFTQVVECGTSQIVFENFDNTSVDQS